MVRTVKIDLAPSDTTDDDVVEEIENSEATGTFSKRRSGALA